MGQVKVKHEDKHIFYVCLGMSIILMITGFLLPPTGVIDSSVLTACGILFGFAALGVAGKNLAIGKEVSIKHGDTTVEIGDDNDDKNE